MSCGLSIVKMFMRSPAENAWKDASFMQVIPSGALIRKEERTKRGEGKKRDKASEMRD